MTSFKQYGLQLVLIILFVFLLSAKSYAFENKISERTHKRLTIIHRLMAEKQYDKALSRLDALAKHVTNRRYDNAYVQQTYGYLYLDQEKLSDAIVSFNKSIDLNAMAIPVLNQMRLSLVQLYANDNQLENAEALFKAWLNNEKKPSAEGLAIGAGVYFDLKLNDLALKYLKRAINTSSSPKEYWYQLLVSIYFHKQDYHSAVKPLKVLLALNPSKKEYWIQLSGVYQQLRKQNLALSTYYLAYQNGLLNNESSIVQLANLFIAENIPNKAARVLNESISNNVFNATEHSVNVLYRAYVRSNDIENAILTLEKLYSLTNDIETKIDIGQLQMEIEQWEFATKSFQQVIQSAENKSLGKAYFLSAISNYELKRYKEAVSLFKNIDKGSSYYKKSIQWIAYINN